MGRHLCAAPALLIAATLAGCHPAAAPANSSPPPAANTAVASAAPAPAADMADAADAKAFLEALYAHYRTSKNNDFQPFDANERDVFDPDMIALLKADQKAMKGDVGALDGDWLCGCQDFESLRATIAVQSATPTVAEATSDFRDTGIADATQQHESFDLVKVGGAWRIHDIHTSDQPSLRKVLTDEIASQRKGGSSTSGSE
jgi:hypothetical protein